MEPRLQRPEVVCHVGCSGFVRVQGKLKEITLARMSEFVIKDRRLPVLLDRCAITRSLLLPTAVTNYRTRGSH